MKLKLLLSISSSIILIGCGVGNTPLQSNENSVQKTPVPVIASTPKVGSSPELRAEELPEEDLMEINNA